MLIIQVKRRRTLVIYTFVLVAPHLLETANILQWQGSRTVVAIVSEARRVRMKRNAPEYSSSRVVLRVET